MKKIRVWLGVLFVMLLLAACGEGDSSDGANTGDQQSGKVLAEEDYAKMYTEPKKYKGYEVTQSGKVFTEPEYDEDGVYLQAFADAKNSEKNTILFYADPSFEVESQQYVQWTGIVKDEFKGENMMGGKVVAPVIEVKDLKVVSYFDVMAPTLETIELNETQNQHGYELTVEKVEVAKEQFRVFVTVENKTEHNINFYTFNTKVIADGKQLEEVTIYEDDVESVQSDILPGVKTSGVIVYPSVGEVEEVRLYAEGSSDNYDIDIEPFQFDIPLK